MKINILDVDKLKDAFALGTKKISDKQKYIDDLNVFPVPDGDTGTNLTLTTSGAINTLSNECMADLALMTKTFARGLLMNAKGNSGVIFSQIFKGFSLGFKPGQKTCNIDDLVDCFKLAKECAYKAVSNPIEGTILTVISTVSCTIEQQKQKIDSIDALFKIAYDAAEQALAKTPSLLPMLKQAGVVDSGGYGLTRFIEGLYLSISDCEKSQDNAKKNNTNELTTTSNSNSIVNTQFVDNNVGFGYCCEFIMQLGSRVSAKQRQKEQFDELKFKKVINKMGNSFVYVRDENIVKVHVHVIKPYELLEFASQYGEFNKIKIDNMTLQFILQHPNSILSINNKNNKRSIKNVTKIISVVPTLNLFDYYRDKLGISNLINTEDTGNPSIQLFYDSIKRSEAKRVILITNDSNTIMAAKQAIELVNKKDINVALIQCPDIGLNYICSSLFDKKISFDKNVKLINEKLKNSISGRIAIASKDITCKNIKVKKNDYIGFIGKDIISSSVSIDSAFIRLISRMLKIMRRPRKVILLYGKDFSSVNLQNIEKYLNEEYKIFPEIIYSGHEIYQFIVCFSE